MSDPIVIVRRLLHLEAAPLEADAALALCARSLPYNARYALGAAGVVLVATCTADAPARRAWLEACLTTDAPPAPAAAGHVASQLETLRWLAAAKEWDPVDGEGPSVRFTIRGEPHLPPVVLTLRPHDVLIARPLPLLPATSAAAAVRIATAHAVLRLNACLPAARVRVVDPAALTLTVEAALPADGACEMEADWLLEGVRHGAGSALAALECLRNPAVAIEYAIAHCLPDPTAGRELSSEV